MLTCVERCTRTYPLLLEQKRFGVNILHEEQQAIARYYADVSQDHERATHLGVQYSYTERGTPLLERALVQLDCALISSYDAGDHTIFIGEVQQVVMRVGRPLLFYRGQFGHWETEPS